MAAFTKHIDSTYITTWGRLVLLGGITVAATIYSPAAGAIAALAMILVLVNASLALLLSVALLVWVPMRGIFSVEPAELVSTAVMARSIETGDVPRQVAIVLLLIIGLCLLFRARCNVAGALAVKCFAAYLALGVLSTLWSADPALTTKRVIAGISCLVFSCGVALGYYARKSDGGRRLVRDICIMGAFACAVLIGTAVVTGNLHILDPAWRLGPLGRENQISWVAAISLVTACATRHERDIWPRRSALIAILCITGAVVVLTKSRTTIIAVAGGLAAGELLQRGLKRRVVAIALLACTLTVIGRSTRFDLFWKRGADQQQIHTVSGRTALWNVVWRDIRARPFVGYGYGGYWSPDRVLLQEIEWAPTSAHNGYLDTAAQLGFVGLALVMMFIALSVRDALLLRRYGAPHQYLGLLLFSSLVWFVITNLTESCLTALDYFPVLALLTLSFYASQLNAQGRVARIANIVC